MIITCPACEAQYLLPDDSIGEAGRRVKCTSCSYTWLQSPEGNVIEDVVEAKEFSYDVERAARRQVYDPRHVVTPIVPEASWGRTFGTGLGLAAFLIVVSLGFLILFKDYAVSRWQPLALFYQTVHVTVPAPGTGLVLENVTAAMDEKEGVLNLKGTINNPSKDPHKLPQFLVRLSGENGWLKDWPINLHDKTMEPGKSVGFAYTLPDAPPQGREVTLRFAD